MILGAVLAGPIVDLLRLSKTTTFEYDRTNTITGEDEVRTEEFSAWRTIMFFGLVVLLVMLGFLICYN
jgi:multisubunit Na+/H+ antiporter MnhB subunit